MTMFLILIHFCHPITPTLRFSHSFCAYLVKLDIGNIPGLSYTPAWGARVASDTTVNEDTFSCHLPLEDERERLSLELLRELHCSGGREFPGALRQRLENGTFGSSLQLLDLSWNSGVTDEIVQLISRCCPSLHTVDLSGTRVSTLSVRILISECKQLEYLGLTSCRGIPREGRACPLEYFAVERS
eukprot:Rmarinus@m.25211